MDAIAPTKERLKHARAHVAPEIGQTTNRPYHRIVDEFDRLYNAGSLEWEQKEAADRLKRHWIGAQGVNVGNGDGVPDSVCEYPRTLHAQKIAEAERVVTPAMWDGLEMLLTEAGGIEHVGGAVCRRKNPVQARAAGLVLIQSALDLIARLWGISSRPPSR